MADISHRALMRGLAAHERLSRLPVVEWITNTGSDTSFTVQRGGISVCEVAPGQTVQLRYDVTLGRWYAQTTVFERKRNP
jgi:hypothetical protein